MASPDYTVERKLDGMRALVHVLPEQDTTLIYSRTGQDLRPQFPELQNLHKQFEHPAILDGEILAESEPGQDNLELLQMRAGDKKARRKDEIPIKFQPFDVLAAILGESETKFDGADHTLRERKEVLRLLTSPTDLKMPEELHAGDKISPKWEGVVVKDLNSKYKAGKRTSEWVKHKAVQRATLLAYDTTPGEGSRAGSFGALKVKDAEGKHVGQIGSGFSDDQIKEIMDKFANGGAPFLVEVEYRFKSKTGLMVNTAYKGLRHDKKIADVF